MQASLLRNFQGPVYMITVYGGQVDLQTISFHKIKFQESMLCSNFIDVYTGTS